MLCLTSFGAWAADSVDVINYQGMLMDTEGAPLEDGAREAMLSIYDTPNPAPGQNAVWTDRQVTLHVLAGVFSVELGDDSPFEGLFGDHDDLYLKITVGGEDMLPLVHLTSVPYAMKAGVATRAETVENGTIDGVLLVSDSVGIGTTSPSVKLQVSGGGDASLSNGSGYVVIGAEGSRNVVIDENEIMARNNGVASKLYLNAEGGNVVVGVLEITGGADIAEPFRFSDAKTIRPGMVVAIDPERTGHLRIADSAYDRTVAGIISGANGIHPGLTMNQTGTIADGSLPVALTGRVYALADASYSAIRPGDLLTTSDTPGHVMRVSDYTRAQGTILGKAMSSLEQGQGLVLVLVTLQ
jgi:hypothetical protein